MTTSSSSPPVVWLVATTFEPRGSSLYTLRLARYLPELGIRPVIVCESDRFIPARLRSQIDVRVVPRMRHRWLGSLALSRLARDESPASIVHSQRRGLERIGEELADEFGCPHLLTVHNAVPPNTVLEVAPHHLSRIVAVSPSVQRDLILHAFVPANLLRMIPSGVDVPDLPRIPASRDPETIPVVGTAAALEPSKGVLYFLMAAELILSAGHDVEFLVAGSGPDEDMLRRAAQHLEISNRVTFATHVVSYTQVIETLDVFVLPSVEQGLGTIMLEAMALGKPVVATRVGGVVDFVVDGEHALLVDKENHVVLADKIELLLDFPEKARQLAIRGQELVRQQFSAERMARETAQLYREVLAPASVAAI